MEAEMSEVERGERKWVEIWGALAEEVVKVSYIAVPMVAVTVMQYLLQVVSVMMVGHLGELSLSSVAIATSLTNVTGFSLLPERNRIAQCKETKHTITESGLTRTGAPALLSLGSKLVGFSGQSSLEWIQRPAVIPRDVREQEVACTTEFLLARRTHDDGSSTTSQRHGWVSYLPTDTIVSALKKAPS
ncbi:MATE efflux family protein [Actinidia rufa]|uniref:MATE efflux family protein n=1 Tax=Actinidia rufa TaxID=165716 RepID=A0A7J0H7A4_9ERIC|nr:MATE efflux family protein [Actinidia rufa]